MTITVIFEGERAFLLEDGQPVARERGLSLARALAETYQPVHHLYVAFSPGRGAYKVGHSEKPHERVRTLKAELVFSRACESYTHMKRMQMALIAEFERCGQPIADEWFALPAEQLADILERHT